MNVDFGDVDGNGYPDIYVTNILAPRYKTDEGNMLWLNLADPEAPHGRRFVNVARRTATHDGGWGWGAKFADFNNDRRLDIFAVNGFATGDPDHTYWYALQEMVTQLKNATTDAADWPEMGRRDLSGYEPNRLWLQITAEPPDGELRFEEIALRAGIDDLYNGRGAAVLDADEDGDLDLYIANQGAPGSFYRNLLIDAGEPGHHFMRLRLVGDPEGHRTDGGRRLASTRDAVGARVRVAAGGVVQSREVDGGCGFAAQSEPTLHFGLGDTTAVESVTIRWPSGRQERPETQPIAAGRCSSYRLVYLIVIGGIQPEKFDCPAQAGPAITQ